MKKNLILGFVLLILLLSFFSGCMEQTQQSPKISIISFVVNPSIIDNGDTANLSWNIQNALSVRILPNIGNVSLTGSYIVMPSETTVYTLTAVNATKTISVNTTLIVRETEENGDDNGDNTSSNGNPIVLFSTSKGIFEVELFVDKVPITSNNFIRLVNDGFYDGMIFYRIMDDFMIQAGRYLADGSEKSSPYGNIDFEADPTVRHVDGAISMASTGAGVGGSAEFFICDGAQAFLDDNYAVFGVVVEGMDVVRDIADEPHDNSSPAGGGKPYTDIVIYSITIM